MGKFRGSAQNSAFCGKMWSLFIVVDSEAVVCRYSTIACDTRRGLDSSVTVQRVWHSDTEHYVVPQLTTH